MTTMEITSTAFINAPLSLEEALENRAVRDHLSLIPHPNEGKAQYGFTFLDHLLWRKKQGYSSQRIMSDILHTLNKARQEELRESIVRG